MISHLSDLLHHDTQFKTALLFKAIVKNDVNMVDFLLSIGAPVNAKHADFGTPLSVATLHMYDEITQLLLKHKADVNLSNGKGITPLMIACAMGSDDLIQQFIDNGARVNDITQNGESALMFASVYKQNQAISILLDNNANINIQNLNGYSAFTFQQEHKIDQNLNFDIILHFDNLYNDVKTFYDEKNILESAYTLIKDKIAFPAEKIKKLPKKKKTQAIETYFSTNKFATHTAFHNAIINNDMQMFDYFCDLTHNINEKDSTGMTPLLIATCYRNGPMVEKLIEKGANVNQATSEGVTPLMIATFFNNLAIMKMLVSNKADVNAVTNDGLSALNISNMLEIPHARSYLCKQPIKTTAHTFFKNSFISLNDNDIKLMNRTMYQVLENVKKSKAMYILRKSEFDEIYTTIQQAQEGNKIKPYTAQNER